VLNAPFFGMGKRKSSASKEGRLEFKSSDGLQNIAKNCEMIFNVKDDQSATGGTGVSLNMKYEPENILAILAIPILTVDNAVALKFLLPAAMRIAPELDKFRNLMGSLYLVAGITHFVDCVFGPSHLLTTAGAPIFAMLPQEGQALVLLWCSMGPICWTLSKLGGAGYADIGLILYGLVEVGCAGLVTLKYGPATSEGFISMNAFVNASIVQGVVAGAWLYSSNKPPLQTNK